MKSFRVSLSHYIKEEIVLDVQAPDHDTVKEKIGDIHAAACELQGWSFDIEATPTHIDISVETADHYDSNPDGELSIEPDGMVRIVPEGSEESEECRRCESEKRLKIERALTKVGNCCLDNAEDRKRVVTALMEAL